MDFDLSDPAVEQTEALCAKVLAEDGMQLEYVRNQSPKLCDIAIRENGEAIQFAEYQDSDTCEQLVGENPWRLVWVKNQTYSIVKTAIEKHPSTILVAKDPSEQLVAMALEKDNSLVHSLYGRYPYHCTGTLMKNPSLVSMVPELISKNAYQNSNDMFVLKMLITAEPETIALLEDPPAELCIIAVSKRPSVLSFIKNPSIEVLAAAKDSGWFMSRYLRGNDRELQMHLITENPWAILHISDPTEEMIQKASENPYLKKWLADRQG